MELVQRYDLIRGREINGQMDGTMWTYGVNHSYLRLECVNVAADRFLCPSPSPYRGRLTDCYALQWELCAIKLIAAGFSVRKRN